MRYRAIYYATTLGLLIAYLARPLQPAHAQPAQDAQGHDSEAGMPFITNYRPSDYGAHYQNWAITEDDRGLMYFANPEGVLEYDGVSWRLIPLSNNSYVRSLATDEDGRIWVGGMNEFGYLAPDEHGQLGYVSLADGLPEADRNLGGVWRTVATAEGIYFMTRDRIFRWFDGQLQVLHLDSPCQTAFMLDGQVYIRQWDVGLVRIDGDSLHRVSDWAPLDGENVWSVLPYDEDNNLVVSETKGLWLDDGRAVPLFEPPLQRDSSTTISSLKTD